MQKLFFTVIVIGALVGFIMPSERPAEAEQARVASASTTSTSRNGSSEVRLDRRGDGHFYVDGLVNGQTVNFVVDTGASFVALTEEDAERAGIEVDPKTYQVIGSGASGPVRGQVFQLDRIEIGDLEVTNVRGAVAEGLEQSLLGQSYLSRINSVNMTAGEMTLR